MASGFRILPRTRKVAEEVVARFRGLPVANVSDSMSRMTAGGARLRPMHAGGVMAGPALTVKTRPGDNLMVHKAIALAEPGDVIVVDAGGYCDHAIIGELMMSRARQRGLAGIVIWGAIRDSAEIGAGDYPVYACAATHRGPYKNGPGEINVPVVVAGMPVMPGDIVVGDADGLIAVPQAQAARVLASAKAILEKETAAMRDIVAGTVDRGWVDKSLRDKGYRF